MLLELLKNYADIINGATRMTQRSATAMARTMLIQAGMEPAADMVSKLSEQMIAAQEAQYAMMRRMIQAEVDMAVTRMGAVPTGMTPVVEETQEARAGEDTSPESADTIVVESPVVAPTPSSTETPTSDPEPTSSAAAPAAEAESAQSDPEASTTPPAPAKKAPAKRAPARRTTARKTTPRTPAKKAPAAAKSPTSTPRTTGGGEGAGSPGSAS